MANVHKEAFCLMAYGCVGESRPGARQTERLMHGCGHLERIWNSRDGVTPFMMGCPSCGGHLQHINWGADQYAPDHKPHWGQGIWRDGTPDDAEAIMRRRLESCKGTEYECDEARTEMLVKMAREGGEGEFQQGWPMFSRHGLST